LSRQALKEAAEHLSVIRIMRLRIDEQCGSATSHCSGYLMRLDSVEQLSDSTSFW
jgi:hypothetical protein